MSEQRIILVTGANTGIGFETAKSIYNNATEPTVVIVSGRSLTKVKDAVGSLLAAKVDSCVTLNTTQLDISDDDSIARAAEHISKTYGHLDVLVNNAGASFDMEFIQGKSTQRQAWNSSWDVNVSGTVCLTWALAPLLIKSKDPRLIFVTSGSASLEESLQGKHADRMNKIPEAGWPKSPEDYMLMSYRAAKVGLNMVMREFARLFKEDNVKTWAVSPGFLATNLGGMGPEALRSFGASDPSAGGHFIRDVADGKHDDRVGLAILEDAVQPF